MTHQNRTFQFPLHAGAEGTDVARAQTILVELGFYISEVEQREQRFGCPPVGLFCEVVRDFSNLREGASEGNQSYLV